MCFLNNLWTTVDRMINRMISNLVCRVSCQQFATRHVIVSEINLLFGTDKKKKMTFYNFSRRAGLALKGGSKCPGPGDYKLKESPKSIIVTNRKNNISKYV